MMFKRIFFIALAGFLFFPCYSQGDYCEPVCPKGLEAALSEEEIPLLCISHESEIISSKKEHPRITAAILCITLGPFGAHRLYLGTKPIVPASYTLTLGGGLGLLPVIDLFLITFSKDISRYKNNPHFFMWNE